MKKLITASIAALLLCSTCYAQSVQQSGQITPGHVPVWATNGVIKDSGTAANPAATSFGVMAGQICANSGPVTGPYNAFCMQATQTGGGILSIYNYAGATGGISFNANGVVQGIPLVPLPTTTNDFACFSNTTGSLKDCSGGAVTLNGNNVWTGQNSYTGTAQQFYVATTGNDSNDCLTSPTACLTLQHATNIALGYEALNANVVINIGAGSFAAGAIVTGPGLRGLVSGGFTTTLRYKGAGSGSTTVDEGTNCGTFIVGMGASVSLQAMKVQNTTGCSSAGAAVFVEELGYVVLASDVSFGATGGQQIHVEGNSVFEATKDYTISANPGSSHIGVATGGTYLNDGHVITCSGATAFAPFVLAQNGGRALFLSSTSFSGCGSVTGTRFEADSNAVIDTAGVALVLPGNAPGVETFGGVRTPAVTGTTQTVSFKVGNTVDFNSATTDNAYIITIPAGFTRYRVVNMYISGATHSLTGATVGLFTSTGGSGPVIADGGITVSTASEGTSNNAEAFAGPSIQSFTNTTLYVRVGTAEGSAATATVTLTIEPLS